RAAAEAAHEALPPILGRDRDPKAVEASRANAARAGVDVRFEVAALSTPIDLDAPTGAVVTHPPFGVRMDADRALAPLYRALGGVAPRGWSLTLVCPDRALARRADPRVEPVLGTDAGGLKVTVWRRV
ncbi:MAG: hypothetical protein KC619_24345, partial [Myxococcales bacterium]|nr:hypothetical protein [Myxococcales bacterium]